MLPTNWKHSWLKPLNVSILLSYGSGGSVLPVEISDTIITYGTASVVIAAKMYYTAEYPLVIEARAVPSNIPWLKPLHCHFNYTQGLVGPFFAPTSVYAMPPLSMPGATLQYGDAFVHLTAALDHTIDNCTCPLWFRMSIAPRNVPWLKATRVAAQFDPISCIGLFRGYLNLWEVSNTLIEYGDHSKVAVYARLDAFTPLSSDTVRFSMSLSPTAVL